MSERVDLPYTTESCGVDVYDCTSYEDGGDLIYTAAIVTCPPKRPSLLARIFGRFTRDSKKPYDPEDWDRPHL
jgi:hypothetical protein